METKINYKYKTKVTVNYMAKRKNKKKRSMRILCEKYSIAIR